MNKKILLCGNPNVGKSSIYNKLTSSHEHTGNWTGKTVEVVSKRIKKTNYELIDLPGVYSLSSLSDEEIVTKNTIYFTEYEKIIYVMDSCNIEKNLSLFFQISEVNKNIVVCLNMIDELENKNIKVNSKLMSELLGVPVVLCSSKNNIGFEELISSLNSDYSCKCDVRYSEFTEENINKVIDALEEPYKNRFIALKILEGDSLFIDEIKNRCNDNIMNQKIIKILKKVNSELISDEVSIELNKKSKEIYSKVVESNYDKQVSLIDRLFTSKLIAIPILFLILFLILFITIRLANYPSELLSVIFEKGGEYLVKFSDIVNLPSILSDPLIFGVYRVVSFIVSVMFPPMVIFFFLFTYAEESGLLPRIAFSLDGACSKANCHGKQSLTMCSGFGCNACAIMGSRIIDSKRDKLLAILTNSFIPCNGRFPMIIAIISMFFVNSSNVILVSLYLSLFVLFAIFISFLTSFILSKTILKGYPGFFVLELPDYKKVKLLSVLKTSFVYKSLNILKKAVLISIPAGLIIYILSNTQIGDITIFARLISLLNPLGKILGLDGTILLGFILGLPANEIVLPIIIMGYVGDTSVPLINDYLTVKTVLVNNGWKITTAFCTILFSIMHFPCATTLSTIKSEVGTKWMFYAFLIPLITGTSFLLILNIFI